MNANSQTYGLTRRELEVLHLMAEGLTQKEIANKLFVSRYTVNSHVQHIYEKMDARTGPHAVNKAYRARIILVPDISLN
ncbi:MAG: LuxR C-terminal-related transcriptional regulator [Rhodothermaceae bacterium]|nr:LuxR C-terminal-related transcriptional regulator [Rhodothermaceae bacterium]